MTPEDAARYKVAHGDEVQVAITEGDRELTFGDVIVRVSSTYETEMHIDTDEANAALLSPRAEGMLVPAPGAGACVLRRKPRAQ